MDDLIGEFIAETSELLPALTRELGGLKAAPSDAKILTSFYKFFHTIKAATGFIGLTRLEALGQAGEKFLTGLRSGTRPVSAASTDLIAETLQSINSLVEHIAEHGQEPSGNDEPLIARLNGDGSVAVAKPAPAPKPAPTPTPKPAPSPVAKHAPDVELAPHVPNVTKLPAVEEVRKTPAAPKTDAPIDHATLDQWMEMVGELVETRNRIEHAMGHVHDPRLSAPLKQLSSITTNLRESVVKARATARVNSPELTIAPLLILQVGAQSFALPQTQVAEMFSLMKTDAATLTDDGATLLFEGRRMALVALNQRLELTPTTPVTKATRGEVVVLRVGTAEVALLADAVIGTVEAVVRPASRLLATAKIYAGTCLLGNDAITLVLNAAALAAQHGTGKVSAVELEQPLAHTPPTSFLLFSAGGGQPKAVPLADVLRIAQVKTDEIEEGQAPYGNGRIQLATVPGSHLPTSGVKDVIILGDGKNTTGLVVEEILHIADAPLTESAPLSPQFYRGSMWIDGRITQVIDARYIRAYAQEAAA